MTSENHGSSDVKSGYANRPIATGRMASFFIGTEKLKLQLEDGIGKDSESVTKQLYRFLVLTELIVDNIPQLARSVSDRVHGRRFLEHILARKLSEMAVRYRLPKEQLTELRSLVGDIYVSLRGEGHETAAAQKSKIIEDLGKHRLLLELHKRNP